MKKKTLLISSGIIGGISMGLIGAADFLVNYAIKRQSNADDRHILIKTDNAANLAIINKNEALSDAFVAKWEETHQWQTESITSFDGLILRGISYLANKPTNKWVLLINGYRETNQILKDQAIIYLNHGYNVLLPNNRASGNSEGEYIGFGWLEKEDMKQWIQLIAKKTPHPSIIVQGRSMGGATTMMLAGDNPSYVDLYIEECGYTSAEDILASEMQKRFNLPKHPLLDIGSVICKIKAGYSFKEASSIKQIRKCQKPMLFIHGTKDDFVPFNMLDIVYKNCYAPKAKLEVNGASHTGSRYLEPELYWNTIFEFISKYQK